MNAPASIAMLAEPCFTDVHLTRTHYKRLRFYWQARNIGVGTLTDNIDLDLAAAGLIARIDTTPVRFRITDKGTVELHAEKEREIARRKPHHDLAGRLAGDLRSKGRVTWENIRFLIGEVEQGTRQDIRPDVYSMACTTVEKRINPCVHEIKMSRADFLSDVAKPSKREGYAQIAEVVYYVTPDGLVDPSEVPEGCGLLFEIKEGEFKVIKKPKKRPVKLRVEDFMNLILKPGQLIPL